MTLCLIFGLVIGLKTLDIEYWTYWISLLSSFFLSKSYYRFGIKDSFRTFLIIWIFSMRLFFWHMESRMDLKLEAQMIFLNQQTNCSFWSVAWKCYVDSEFSITMKFSRALKSYSRHTTSPSSRFQSILLCSLYLPCSSLKSDENSSHTHNLMSSLFTDIYLFTHIFSLSFDFRN